MLVQAGAGALARLGLLAVNRLGGLRVALLRFDGAGVLVEICITRVDFVVALARRKEVSHK